LKKKVDELKIDLRRNLCTIGGPVASNITAIGMGYCLNDPSKYNTDLPYIFDLTLGGKLRGKTLNQIRKESASKEYNWWIIDSSNRKPKYIPEQSYFKYRETRYRVDYGMIIVKYHPVEELREKGKKLLILAGCHGEGTLACVEALRNVEILRQIKSKREGSEEFQAIIKAEISGYRRIDAQKFLQKYRKYLKKIKIN